MQIASFVNLEYSSPLGCSAGEGWHTCTAPVRAEMKQLTRRSVPALYRSITHSLLAYLPLVCEAINASACAMLQLVQLMYTTLDRKKTLMTDQLARSVIQMHISFGLY